MSAKMEEDLITHIGLDNYQEPVKLYDKIE